MFWVFFFSRISEMVITFSYKQNKTSKNKITFDSEMIYRLIKVSNRDKSLVVSNASVNELCMRWLVLKVRMHNALVVAARDLHIADSSN